MGPRLIKRLEHLAKHLLALVAALVLYRPWRKHRARRLTASPRRVLLVRIDDRVGEALLTTPLLASLGARSYRPEVHVLVHKKAARVLQGHPMAAKVLALDRRWLALGTWAPGLRALRKERYEVVVNCASWSEASVTAAIVSRLIAPAGALVGPKVWPSSLLQDLSIPARADTRSEVKQRVHLLSALGEHQETGELSFRKPAPSEAVGAFLSKLGGAPYGVVNPGGRLGWRRVAPEIFAAGATAMKEAGVSPVITWGPGEEPLAREVAALVPGAKVAPPTNLDELASLFCSARLSLCNNTGPMHLSVAVGCPTVGLFLRMPIERWGHAQPLHRMVDLTGCENASALVASTVKARLQEPSHSK